MTNTTTITTTYEVQVLASGNWIDPGHGLGCANSFASPSAAWDAVADLRDCGDPHWASAEYRVVGDDMSIELAPEVSS